MQSIENLDEPLLAELYSYWSARRREGGVPSRADIDPIDIPHLLPHLMLAEVVRGSGSNGNDFRIRYRLAGTEIEEHFGCPLTNRFLDDLVDERLADYVMGLYRGLMAEMAPLYNETLFGSNASESLRAKCLLLPLSDDQKTVNLVLAGSIISARNPTRRRTILLAQDDFDEAGATAP